MQTTEGERLTSTAKRRVLSEHLEFWGALTEAEKEMVVSDTHVKYLKAGKYMDYDFENSAGMKLIGKGAVRVIGCFDNGEELTLSLVRGGEACSLSMIDGLDRLNFNVTLEIEEDTYVYVIPKDTYREVLKNPAVYKTELERSHRTLVSIIEAVSFNMLSSVEDKILWNLKNRIGGGRSRTIHVTHEQIAKEIGSAREVVSRTLKSLEKKGLISMRRGAIKVTGNLEDEPDKKMTEVSGCV